MRKLIFGLFSALLMSVGLVGISQTTADAVECGYTGCVETTTTVTGPARVHKGDAATFCVKVSTDGNGRPKGFVTINISRVKGNYGYTATKPFRGSERCFDTPAFVKRGRYRVRAHFEGKATSVFYASTDWTRFRVVR